MNNTKEQLDAIKDIRNMMERSSRFLSLSGLSGVAISWAFHCFAYTFNSRHWKRDIISNG